MLGSSSSRTAGPGHQRARDRQHLLLATGEGAAILAAAFLQAREEREDHFYIGSDALFVGAGEGADLQIL